MYGDMTKIFSVHVTVIVYTSETVLHAGLQLFGCMMYHANP